MGEWEASLVNDLIAAGALAVGDGYRAKNAELGDSGLPFARAGNLNNGFNFANADRVPPETLARVGNKQSRVGDVVFTSKGTVGRLAYVSTSTEPFVYSPQLCFWRVEDSTRLDSRFLFYWLHGRAAIGQFGALKGQTDMADYISLADQRTILVDMPPLPEQRTIAEVLGALDDKIESNRRLALALHALPLHAFRSEFGPTVEGAVPLADLIDRTAGKSYKSSELTEDGPVALLSLKSFKRGGGIQDGGFKPFAGEYKPAQRVEPGEVVVACTDLTQGADVVARPALVPTWSGYETLVASLDVWILRPRALPRSWLYGLLHSGAWSRHARAYANGSTVLHLSPQSLADFAVTPPDSAALARYEAIAGPALRAEDVLLAEARTLTALRDALLPKLVSGKIRVPLSDDVEEQVGAATEALPQ